MVKLRLAQLSLHLGIIGLISVIALVPWQWFYPASISLTSMLALPSWQHLIGTDHMGRDLLVRLHFALFETVLPLWGVALSSQLVGILLAAFTLACLTNYSGLQFVFAALQGFFIVLVSLPVGIMIFLLSIWLEEASYKGVYGGLFVIFTIKVFLELVAAYQEDRNLEYWLSHQALGGRFLERFFTYGIKRNWLPGLINTLCLHLQIAIVVETSLSYLGFGIQEPQASLGNMLSSHFDLFLHGNGFLFLTVVTVLLSVASFPLSLRYAVNSHLWQQSSKVKRTRWLRADKSSSRS